MSVEICNEQSKGTKIQTNMQKKSQ